MEPRQVVRVLLDADLGLLTVAVIPPGHLEPDLGQCAFAPNGDGGSSSRETPDSQAARPDLIPIDRRPARGQCALAHFLELEHSGVESHL